MADELTPDAVDGAAPPAPDAVDGTPAPPDAPQIPEGLQKLQSVLESHNLTDADSVQSLVEDLGKFKQGYGNSQNELGEVRRQLTALQQQLQQTPQVPDDPYAEPPAVDLKQQIESSVTKAIGDLMNNYQQANIQGRQQYLAQVNRLEKMPNWAAVKPAFDQAMSNPQIQQAMQSGQTDMEKVYLYLNQGFLLNVAQGAQDAIDKIPEGARRALKYRKAHVER